MKNIMHLEDIAFSYPLEDILEIMSALTMAVGGEKVGDLNIKYDGTALVFGNKDGFFISDHAYSNKEPLLYRSDDDIFNREYNDEKTRKLLLAFELLKHRYQNGVVYHADWLFDEWSMVDDNTFQPNIIQYRRRSHLRDYRLGIAVHTQEFCGVDRATDWNSSNPDIYCAPVSFKVDELKGYKSLFSLQRELKLHDSIDPKAVKTMRSHLNTCIKGNDSYTKEQLVALGHTNLIFNLDILIRFKYILLQHLDSVNGRKNQFDMTIAGEQCPHEGYVFRYKGQKVKLVDRYRFSKRNFDPNIRRGWANELQGISIPTG
jgi:hypothetical protein